MSQPRICRLLRARASCVSRLPPGSNRKGAPSEAVVCEVSERRASGPALLGGGKPLNERAGVWSWSFGRPRQSFAHSPLRPGVLGRDPPINRCPGLSSVRGSPKHRHIGRKPRAALRTCHARDARGGLPSRRIKGFHSGRTTPVCPVTSDADTRVPLLASHDHRSAS